MTIIAVTDTETTGLGDTAQVVEIAVVTLLLWGEEERGAKLERLWTQLVRPTVPIEFEAMAVHHITEDEVRLAPTMGQLLAQGVLEGEYGNTIFAAHNAEFDRRLLLQSGVPLELLPSRTICTWRCSLHLWPDAPSHKNQALRYWLGLDVPGLRGATMHRALPDATVTAALLARMLTTHTVEELLVLSALPALQITVRMRGEQHGKLWADVPADYLAWIVRKGPERNVGARRVGFDQDVVHTAEHWLKRRRAGT